MKLWNYSNFSQKISVRQFFSLFFARYSFEGHKLRENPYGKSWIELFRTFDTVQDWYLNYTLNLWIFNNVKVKLRDEFLKWKLLYIWWWIRTGDTRLQVEYLVHCITRATYINSHFRSMFWNHDSQTKHGWKLFVTYRYTRTFGSKKF